MALFVLGAGATRGCSFVNPSINPSVPPLDADFFTQLQRIKSGKHSDLVSSVINDTVDVFGNNFNVGMEQVFTTLEHSMKMVSATRETRRFGQQNLREKRDRLVQAIAATLEEAIASTSTTPQECVYHDKLVCNILQCGDDILSFNYDCIIDDSLRRCGDEKWNPRYGYGFNLGSRGSRFEGDEYWRPSTPATRDRTIHCLKLHGSLHFRMTNRDDQSSYRVKLKQRPYTKQHGDLHFDIIPPEWNKTFDSGAFSDLWKRAAEAIHRAEHIVLIGYSLPPTDIHSTALFRTSVRRGNLKSLVVVNPDRLARARTRDILQTGLSPSSRVLSFDYMDHFVAADRDVWAV